MYDFLIVPNDYYMCTKFHVYITYLSKVIEGGWNIYIIHENLVKHFSIPRKGIDLQFKNKYCNIYCSQNAMVVFKYAGVCLLDTIYPTCKYYVKLVTDYSIRYKFLMKK